MLGLVFHSYIESTCTSLTSTLLLEVPVSSRESEQSCICELGVWVWPLSTILVFYFGIDIFCLSFYYNRGNTFYADQVETRSSSRETRIHQLYMNLLVLDENSFSTTDRCAYKVNRQIIYMFRNKNTDRKEYQTQKI